ncbi:MAG: hypothetical protein ABSE95_02070 [Thermodesulfobacteriota bacterium]|jgi:hypothetical protein
MGVTTEYRRQVLELTEDLPKEKIKELITFAQFLRTKKPVFSYSQIEDSAEYVEKMRRKEGKKVKSGKKFIEELIEWQRLNS